jgi:regulator of protease activity HflC (stomatin/prohibitin superfamily)
MAPLLAFLLFISLLVMFMVGRWLWRLLRPARVVLLEHQRGVLYRNGRLTDVLSPGVYWGTARRQIFPVDVRKQLHQVPGQEILTSDGIAVKVSAALEYSVTDPKVMMNSSTNFVALVYSQAQLSLRTAVGELSLDGLLGGREVISSRLLALLKPLIAELGAELSSARILDIMLPADVRRAYAQAVTAQKEGVAALERARGETAAMRSLANAARTMQDHPGLLQLRAVQAIEASKGNTTLELKMADPRG